jgi:hypothetical protein
MGNRISHRSYLGRLPDVVSERIIRAVQGSEPEKEVEIVLGMYRRKSYYETAVAEARTRLRLKELELRENL